MHLPGAGTGRKLTRTNHNDTMNQIPPHWTTEGLFAREHFEHWLSQQPGDRSWEFTDVFHCVACAYLNEFHNLPDASSGTDSSHPNVWKHPAHSVPWPKWLESLLIGELRRAACGPLVARDLKAALGLTESQEPTPTKGLSLHEQTQTQEAHL
jgi:hypothetical protein